MLPFLHLPAKQPRSRHSGASATSRDMALSFRACAAMVERSNTPYQATPPWTQSEAFEELTLSGAPAFVVCAGASALALQLTAARAARCPPAETPQVTARLGSIPYVGACDRSQRIAAFTSWIGAGKRASPLRRYSTDAT